MSGINRKCGICIRGVSDACTNELLQAAFSRFGNITDTYVKAQRGYAFVTFTEEKSVAVAIEGAPSSIGEDQVTVEARRPLRDAPASNNLYIKGLPEDTTDDMVADAVANYGEPTSIQVKADRGFAFVGFASVEEASAVVTAAPLTINGVAAAVEFRLSKVRTERKARGGERKEREGGEGGGEGKRRRKPRPRRRKKIVPNSIWIKGVPEDCKDEDISGALSEFGSVVSVDHRDGRDFAFLVFETAEGMAGAVNSSGAVKIGGSAVTIQERTGKKPVGVEGSQEQSSSMFQAQPY